MVLRQPNVIKSVVLAPNDLIKNLSVEPVGGLAPLGRISEVVSKTKAYFSIVLTHGITFLLVTKLAKFPSSPGRKQDSHRSFSRIRQRTDQPRAEAGEGRKPEPQSPRPFRWERLRVRAISSSGCECKLLNQFVLFMRLSLFRAQVHSWPASILRGRPTMLLRATIRSQLLAQCAPSKAE